MDSVGGLRPKPFAAVPLMDVVAQRAAEFAASALLNGAKFAFRVGAEVAFHVVDLTVAVCLLLTMLLGPKPLRVAQTAVLVYMLLRLLAAGIGG